jgi:transposase
MFLLPPSLRDWLPENHLVYFVSDVVDQLDLSKIESVYEKDDRGQPPFHPRMMTRTHGTAKIRTGMNCLKN